MVFRLVKWEVAIVGNAENFKIWNSYVQVYFVFIFFFLNSNFKLVFIKFLADCTLLVTKKNNNYKKYFQDCLTMADVEYTLCWQKILLPWFNVYLATVTTCFLVYMDISMLKLHLNVLFLQISKCQFTAEDKK